MELTKCTEKLLRKSPNYANYEENPYLTFLKPIFLLIRGTQFCRVINLKIRLYYFPKTIFLFFFLSHYNMHVKSWYHQISVDIGVRYTHWIHSWEPYSFLSFRAPHCSKHQLQRKKSFFKQLDNSLAHFDFRIVFTNKRIVLMIVILKRTIEY